MRGIHQGLITFSKSNKEYYPGLKADGTTYDLSVERRFWLLMDNDFFSPEYAISPWETDPMITAWDNQKKPPVMAKNYSYALLQIPKRGGRRKEWSATLNTQAIILADRNTGTPSGTYGYRNNIGVPRKFYGYTYRTVQPYRDSNHWVGKVLWNDSFDQFRATDIIDTKYGGVSNTDDHLFRSSGTDDALLIHSGN